MNIIYPGNQKDTLLLMKKKILLIKSAILYDRPVTTKSLAEEWVKLKVLINLSIFGPSIHKIGILNGF